MCTVKYHNFSFESFEKDGGVRQTDVKRRDVELKISWVKKGIDLEIVWKQITDVMSLNFQIIIESNLEKFDIEVLGLPKESIFNSFLMACCSVHDHKPATREEILDQKLVFNF